MVILYPVTQLLQLPVGLFGSRMGVCPELVLRFSGFSAYCILLQALLMDCISSFVDAFTFMGLQFALRKKINRNQERGSPSSCLDTF